MVGYVNGNYEDVDDQLVLYNEAHQLNDFTNFWWCKICLWLLTGGL